MIDVGRVYMESCIETMGRMGDGEVDLVVTSPPYDGLREYRGYEWDFEGVARGLWRVLADGGVLVWVIGDEIVNYGKTLTSFRQGLYFVDEVGFVMNDVMIYEKVNGVPPYPNVRRYAQRHEYMFVLVKGGKPRVFNGLMEDKISSQEAGWSSERQRDGSLKRFQGGNESGKKLRGNVWKYYTGKNKDTKDDIALGHPARFPEMLAADHIKSWSNEGDLVYDPFMGSGTVAKMCIMLGRRWVGSEISSEYCELIEKRLALYRNRLFA